MKKFACLMLAASLSLFTLGCEPAKKPDDASKKPDATASDKTAGGTEKADAEKSGTEKSGTEKTDTEKSETPK